MKEIWPPIDNVVRKGGTSQEVECSGRALGSCPHFEWLVYNKVVDKDLPHGTEAYDRLPE